MLELHDPLWTRGTLGYNEQVNKEARGRPKRWMMLTVGNGAIVCFLVVATRGERE